MLVGTARIILLLGIVVECTAQLAMLLSIQLIATDNAARTATRKNVREHLALAANHICGNVHVHATNRTNQSFLLGIKRSNLIVVFATKITGQNFSYNILTHQL
jgi:hypothetical protein